MSGVYIKGMEMHQNCEECDVKVVCKNYWKLIREQYTRPSWCPLVHVQPHGRLIDADALMDALPDDFLIPSAAAKVIERTIIPASVTDINVPTIIPAEEATND